MSMPSRGFAPAQRAKKATIAEHRAAPPTPEQKTSTTTPQQQLVLDTQTSVGNKAVSELALQRDFLGTIKAKLGRAPKPPTPTHEKTKAKQMTHEEGQQEMARVKQQVQEFIDLKNKLESKGASPEAAAKMAYDSAPPDIRRYLPLTSDFDVAKRLIDKERLEEGAKKQSQISKGLQDHAKKYGYQQGGKDPIAAKPSDIEKDIKKDRDFMRQLERIAERRIRTQKETLLAQFESAKEAKNTKTMRQALEKMKPLEGENALQNEMFTIALDAKAAVENKYRKLVEEQKKELKLEVLSQPEHWRLMEEAKHKVRKDMEQGDLDPDLATAGSVVGTIGSIGSKVAKGTKIIGGKTVPESAKSLFKGTTEAIAGGLKAVGGIFSKSVKLAGTLSDVKAGKGDIDSDIEIAGHILAIIKDAAAGARSGIKAAQTLNDALGKDPGLAAAVPGLGIFAASVGIVANVVDIIPPSDRLNETLKGKKSALGANNDVLAGAFGRTTIENSYMVATEVVGAISNMIRIAAGIVELATAGGFGIPMAIKGAATVLDGAMTAAEFLKKESLRAQTQDARKKGALQLEGSGEKLIKTDVTYAVDMIATAGMKAAEKKKSGKPLTGSEQAILNVLAAYGLSSAEVGRLSMGEIHEKMMDKLKQDDEQKTLGMKAKEGLKAVKEAISELGGKEEKYESLDEYARKQEEEANKGIGDTIKGGLKKAGGYVVKAVTAPAKIVKLHEMRKEKSEKLDRLVAIKNEVNYKDRSDRGTGYKVANFGVDLEKSILKLRHFIIQTQPKEKVPDLLKRLNTVAEEAKISKGLKEKAEEQNRARAKVTDRVITPGFVEKTQDWSLDQIQEALLNDKLTWADEKYLYYLQKQKTAGFGKKKK